MRQATRLGALRLDGAEQVLDDAFVRLGRHTRRSLRRPPLATRPSLLCVCVLLCNTTLLLA